MTIQQAKKLRWGTILKMTPTEQDKELRELVHIVQNADTTYDAMQFIKADRKRVELEARLDELIWSIGVTYKYDKDRQIVQERIAELKAQQEQTNDQL